MQDMDAVGDSLSINTWTWLCHVLLPQCFFLCHVFFPLPCPVTLDIQQVVTQSEMSYFHIE